MSSNRPSKKSRKRERREAQRHKLTIEQYRTQRDSADTGRGRKRREQAGGE